MDFTDQQKTDLAGHAADAAGALSSLQSALDTAAVRNPTDAQLDAIQTEVQNFKTAQEGFISVMEAAGADRSAAGFRHDVLHAVSAAKEAGDGTGTVDVRRGLPAPATVPFPRSGRQPVPELLDSQGKRRAWELSFVPA